MREIIFPLFVRAKDSGEIASFNSVRELQFQLERIDVENQEYEVWDRHGHLVDLEVTEPLWLKAEPSRNGSDVSGLRRALLGFGNAVGIQLPVNLDITDFARVLQQIREAQENKKLARSPIRRFFSRRKK